MSKAAEDSSLAEPLIPDDDDLSERLTVDGKEEEVVVDEELENLTWSRGEKQPNTCNDGLWAILFLIQVVVVVAIAVSWGLNMPTEWPSFNDDDDTSDSSQVYGGLSLLLLFAALGSCAVASVALVITTHFAAQLIQASILFNILISLAFSVFSFTQDEIGMGVGGSVTALIGILYAWSIWPMIPWAASNLVTAVTAIRTNVGVSAVGLGIVLLTSAYTLLWMLALFGTVMQLYSCDESGHQCTSHINGIIVALFLLSFYWTIQVLKNILHVTVAGVVGTWWFAPEDASSSCSPSVKDSLGRACTTSFGSICLGSLLVALIQLLHDLVRNARRHNGGGVLYCILECLVALVQSFMEYFNKWGFIYVGLYGYNYWEASPKVLDLFRQRGWTTILNDQLIYRVLSWMSLVMGALSGLLVVVVVKLHPSLLQGFDTDTHATVAFFLGLIVGTMLSNILLSIIASAVDTVLVCFAEAPLEFRHSYPELSAGMEEAWRNTFPTEYRLVADSTMV